MIKKEHLKKEDNKRKKEKYDNLYDNKRERMKKRTSKEKKRDNLHDNERVQLRKKKVMRDSLGDDEKEEFRKNDKRKMDKRLQTLDKRSSICNNVQMCSMTDPCILTTPAFRLIEDFKSTIEECPTNICDIYDITQIHDLETIISVSKFQ